jgi:uncharacterized protein YjbJ (UPF0337 family)
MDKDRIAGAAKEIKGSVKKAIGKAVGDAKLQSDGNADKVEGKIQNAIGGLKDALRKLGLRTFALTIAIGNGSASRVNQPSTQLPPRSS